MAHLGQRGDAKPNCLQTNLCGIKSPVTLFLQAALTSKRPIVRPALVE